MILKNYIQTLSLLPNIVFCQWLSFDLTQADQQQFSQQVKPTIVTSSLSQNFFEHTFSNSNRLEISIAFPIGIDLSGSSFQENPLIYPPMASLSYLITDNLAITGKMNLMSMGEETMHSAGYSGHYLTNSWTTGLGINWMEGPKYLRVRSINGSIIKGQQINLFNVTYGVGHSNYKGSILDLDEINSIKSSISYLIFGISTKINGINISSQSSMHSSFVQLNILFSMAFL